MRVRARRARRGRVFEEGACFHGGFLSGARLEPSCDSWVGLLRVL